MQHSSDQTSCLKLLDVLGNELLPLEGLLANFLLDGSGMWADSKVVLDYLPGNTGDIRWLPGKHIDIRPQEGNERAFLFVIKGGADSESTINASQPCRDLLHLGCSNLGSLAVGTLRHVVNGCRALGGDTVPGLLAGVPTTSLLSFAFLGGSCRCHYHDSVPVHLVHTNDCILLI